MPRLYNRRSFVNILALSGVLTVLLAGCGQMPPTPAPSGSPEPAATAAPERSPTPPASPSAAPTATATPEPAAALVNGRPISLADYTAEAARCQAAQAYPDCPARALQGLIEQAVVEHAAAAAGLVVSEGEVSGAVAEIQNQLGGPTAYQAWLAAHGYTEAAFAEALRRERLRAHWAEQVMGAGGETAEQVRAQIILAGDEATAQNLLTQLQSGADFAALAVNYSLDLSSRVAGGDLGWFPRGWLTAPEVEQAAFALQPGETSPVVAGTLGFYIVRVLERDPVRALDPAMRPVWRERVFQTWLAGALAQATIERRVTP